MSRLAMSCVACRCCDPVRLGEAVGEANRQGNMVQTDEDRWYSPRPFSPLPLGGRFSRVDDSVRTGLGTYVFLLAKGGRSCWPRGIRQCQHRNTAARISVRPTGRRTDPPGEGDGREGGREGRWRPNPGTERAPRSDWTAFRGGRTTQRPRIPSIPACGAVGEVTANGRRRPADAGFLGGFPGPRANLARRPPPPSLRLHAPAMHGS